MVPDIATRLQTMVRAMAVVIRAFDPQQKLALEQANLVMSNLRVLADQHAHSYEYEMADLHDQVALVKVLLESAEGGPSTQANASAAEALLRDAAEIAVCNVPSQSSVVDSTRKLKSIANDLVRAAGEDGTAAFKRARTDAVMKFAQRQITRERVWVIAAGFEAHPEDLPPLSEVIEFRN